VLLCSLLLGFGLDAYVVLGTRRPAAGAAGDRSAEGSPAASGVWSGGARSGRRSSSGKAGDDGAGGMAGWQSTVDAAAAEDDSEYAWCLTRYPAHSATASSGGAGGAAYTVAFWDPLTGQRLGPAEASLSGHVFSTVSCCFNHDTFVANHALDPRVEHTRWDWDELTQWKPVSGAKRFGERGGGTREDAVGIVEADAVVAPQLANPPPPPSAHRPPNADCMCAGGAAAAVVVAARTASAAVPAHAVSAGHG